jgi:hypothetical protein
MYLYWDTLTGPLLSRAMRPEAPVFTAPRFEEGVL